MEAPGSCHGFRQPVQMVLYYTAPPHSTHFPSPKKCRCRCGKNVDCSEGILSISLGPTLQTRSSVQNGKPRL